MNITLPRFHEPSFEDAALIPALQCCPSRACEYTFANIMMWRRQYHTEIAAVGNTVFVRFGKEDIHYLAPAGGDFQENLHTLKVLHSEKTPLMVFGYDENDMDRLTSQVSVLSREEFRDEFDYIYRVSDLAALPGKRYHGKRNHIAAFSRQYAWQYETLNEENVAEVHELANRWYAAYTASRADKDDSLKEENRSIHELLDHRTPAQIVGGLLRVDGRAVAFTFGAPLCADTFDTLVEKALPEYAGAYAVINREFAARELGGFVYVNRENDVGAEGLRRAKLSYHPAMMVKKTLCTIGG